MSSPVVPKLYAKLTARIHKADTGCWEWTGPRKKRKPGSLMEYGLTSVWRPDKKRSFSINVHRAMWIALHGWGIGRWDLVCHKCDNQLCCNPEHLYLGTHLTNQRDMRDRGRDANSRKTHCPRGHSYEEHGQKNSQGYKGWRNCRVCQRARLRIKAGWPTDLAYSMPVQKKGYNALGLGRWGNKRKRLHSNANEQRT